VPSTPLTRGQTSSFVKLILVGLAVQLAVIGYVAYSTYVGRENVVTASRAGCERNKLDRIDNANGWRTAEVARMHGAARTLHIPLAEVKQRIKKRPKPDDPVDLVAAWKYDRIAEGLETRSRVSCPKAFPKAGLFP
jgi:hypothetical protein